MALTPIQLALQQGTPPRPAAPISSNPEPGKALTLDFAGKFPLRVLPDQVVTTEDTPADGDVVTWDDANDEWVASPVVTVPSGAMLMWGTGTAPTGWLLCNGSSLLRADYADLFAVIGTTFGAVDGTHFTLPDMRNRAVFGLGSNTDTNVMGETGGAVTHTHSVSGSTAGHNHAYSDSFSTGGHAHTVNSHSHDLNSHTHTSGSLATDSQAVDATGLVGGGSNTRTSTHSHAVNSGSTGAASGSTGTASPSMSTASDSGTISGNTDSDTDTFSVTSGTGSSYPPYITLNFIIKT